MQQLFQSRSTVWALILISGFILFGCIEEFNPKLTEHDELLVIDGSIIKGNNTQKVVISLSTPFYQSEFKPVSGCEVRAEDDRGNSFNYSESSKGIYLTSIPQSNLLFNSKFKLHIKTPSGNIYESEFEPILENSPVDSIYFANEPYQSSSELHEEGLQFYADLKAPMGATRNYRWTLEETYEYQSSYIINAIWLPHEDSLVYDISSYNLDNLSTCWKTERVNGIFSSSTANLTVNEKKKIPLNYVPGISYKLSRKYSLLVKQYSLSENAYQYWNTKRVESSQSDGLYQKQPSQSKSNIRNSNNPDEIVLGYFWAASFSEKRIFFKGPLIRYILPVQCVADTFDRNEPVEFFPITYLTVIGSIGPTPIFGVAPHSCFDCRIFGGINRKPEFWE